MGAEMIPGAIGAILQMDSNKKSADNQKKALDSQKLIADRAIKLFDTMFKRVSDADAQGQFNPETYIKQLDKDYLKQEGVDMSNMGSAYSAAGYAPGTSEVRRSLNAFKTKSQSNLDRMRVDLRRQTFADLLNSYSAIGQGGLQMASNTYGQSANMYGSQQQNPMGLFASMMPFFNRRSSRSGGFESFGPGSNSSSGSPQGQVSGR